MKPMDLLDLVYSLALKRPRFFEEGWGDRATFQGVAECQWILRDPDPIDVELGLPGRREGMIVRTGSFESPEGRLRAGRRARIRLLEPPGDSSGAVVFMAGLNDHGFTNREVLVGPLVRRGLTAVLLENPYCGTRRPVGQVGSALRTVSDLALMATAAVREGRALTRWLTGRRRGAVGVAGCGLGGHLACLIGASSPFPLAVATFAPAISLASIFLEGYLRHAVDMNTLGGPEERPLFRRRLSELDVLALSRPPEGSVTAVLGAGRDGIVPPGDSEAIAAHWGAELRWLPCGHVSALAFHAEAFRSAVHDAFTRLPSPSGTPASERHTTEDPILRSGSVA